jgi:hypothetical protein
MAESSQLEQQIADLERQLESKRQELGGAPSEQAPSDRELVHEHVGEQIKQQMPSYQPSPAPAPSATPSDDTASWQDPAIAQQVQELVNTAFTKSLDEAIGDAVKTGNAALIDAFHDLVRDRLIGELAARGKFTPVS